MFARAVQQHQISSSQQKAQKLPVEAVQKTIDFNAGVKRKALDVLEDANKRAPVPQTSVKDHDRGKLAALVEKDSFGDRKGQIVIDGVAFDEAAFDDIVFDDWDVQDLDLPAQSGAKASNAGRALTGHSQDSEDFYFQDDVDMDWTDPMEPPPESPKVVAPSNAVSSKPLSQEVLQNKENTFPSPEQPPAAGSDSLAKTLFPSSAPFPWSPTQYSAKPEEPKAPKRTLPWVKYAKRYGSPPGPNNYGPYAKNKIKSIVRMDTSRGLSTMGMEATVDWDVLGITEKDLSLTKVKYERQEDLAQKRIKRETSRMASPAVDIKPETKTGVEWLDEPTAANNARRQRKKTEEKERERIAQHKKEHEKKQIAKIFLSPEQQNVRNLVVDGGKSVFFTGSAGTGKSVLLREIISALKKTHERAPDAVAVTASTGLAACNVGGVTLHSFAGVGLGKEDVQSLVKHVKRNRKSFDRWRRTKVLIIDEISMVDAVFFDKLEELARILRKNGRPFGGIQLVITGDFFQLPPVPDRGQVAKFAFEAKGWKECIPHTIRLNSVFRQKDQEFVAMLNEMRLGTLSQASIQKFRALQRKPQFDDNMEPTELFPKREQVDRANNTRLYALPGKLHKFQAEEGGSMMPPQRDNLLSNCMAPKILELKKDAQVMLIKNMDENLVNGSLGKVIGFMSESTYGLCVSEGLDLDDAFGLDGKIDDPYGFKTLEEEDGDSEGVLRKKKRILSLQSMAAESTQLWPVVRFTTATGLHVDRLVTREKWDFELPNGEVQAYRRQVPLILAYAISIHKAQGQTLSRVRVDLGDVFEKGQAYVALSRATTREGLQILRFDPSKVMAHPKVAGFYRSLEDVETVMKNSEPQKNWKDKALAELLEREEDFEEEIGEFAYA